VLAAGGDACGCNLLYNAEFMPESSALLGGTSVQEFLTGNVAFM
jgi:hypothetical protein